MAIVRTQEGSDKFKLPIGSPLDDLPVAAAEQAVTPVSPVRLRSLRALILDKIRVGDKASAQALTEKFRIDFARFAKDKTPEQIDQALNKAA